MRTELDNFRPHDIYLEQRLSGDLLFLNGVVRSNRYRDLEVDTLRKINEIFRFHIGYDSSERANQLVRWGFPNNLVPFYKWSGESIHVVNSIMNMLTQDPSTFEKVIKGFIREKSRK